MNKVLVTGVNGFVGNHVVDALLAQNYEVIGVGREETANNVVGHKLVGYYSCDLSVIDQVNSLPLHETLAVINLAGLAAVGPSFDNPELYMRINTAVVDNVCRAAIQQDAKQLRIVSISSGAVYSSQQPMPLAEDSKLAPESSPYAASKIAMEELSLSYREQGIDCVVARPFNHIGPGQGQGFILPDLYQKVTTAIKNNESEIRVGNLTTKRDYTDVRDVARAYVSLVAADELQHGIYNVCTGRSLSGEQILAMLLDSFNSNITTKIDEKSFRPSDAPDLYGNNSLLNTNTGWQPEVNIEQTIKDFVVSMRSHEVA